MIDKKRAVPRGGMDGTAGGVSGMSDYRISGRKSDWVSVKDRLPEWDEDVLVYKPGGFGDIVVAFRAGYDGCNWKWYDTLEYSRLREEPTHWMPLPDPPTLSCESCRFHGKECDSSAYEGKRGRVAGDDWCELYVPEDE